VGLIQNRAGSLRSVLLCFEVVTSSRINFDESKLITDLTVGAAEEEGLVSDVMSPIGSCI
jgi:hypothetical protein